MEEIDIIELLKRVKEGKAPRKIEVEGFIFYYNNETNYISEMYQSDTCYWEIKLCNGLNTKIKILDKPIIEELPEDIDFIATIKDDQMKAEQIGENRKKINEIIRYLRSKDER